MEPKLGALFQEQHLDVQKIMHALIELCTGLSKEVTVHVEHDQMVLKLGELLFVSVLPQRFSVRIHFPMGDEIFDPKKRLEGVVGYSRHLLVRDKGELDIEFRRILEDAFRILSKKYAETQKSKATPPPKEAPPESWEE